jgi:transcriptional regulator with GAF, ATPase, and Fis domain
VVCPQGRQGFEKDRQSTLDVFQSYDGSGNIREQQNAVERSVIENNGDVFCVLEAWLSNERCYGPSLQPVCQFADGGWGRERDITEAALAKCQARDSGPRGTAAKLRVLPSTFSSTIMRLKIAKSHLKIG